MDVKKIAAGAATAGLLGLGGLGVGVGLAQADPQSPPPRPSGPGSSDNSGNQGNRGPQATTITGPGVNAGAPGNPLPPGLGYLPPPGHGGPMPQDRIPYPSTPAWVTTKVTPPAWAPPEPAELPNWATGMPVFWNSDLNTWGVWDAQTGVFVRL